MDSVVECFRKRFKEGRRERLGMTRALLCADTRVREFRAGGRPYRWVIEYKQGQAWRKVSITGLVFWRYFSKRTQHIYQNETLPVTKLPA